MNHLHCITNHQTRAGWVTGGKAHYEHNESAYPPDSERIADMAAGLQRGHLRTHALHRRGPFRLLANLM
jgi:hypothetical protein